MILAMAALWRVGGCALISEADLAARMDLDGDGVPRPDDCDDADPDVTDPTLTWADADGVGSARAAGSGRA